MRGRRMNVQDGETSEMARTLEGGGNTLAADGRVGNERDVDEKKGNEEDQRHMRRLGKAPELRVSRLYDQR